MHRHYTVVRKVVSGPRKERKKNPRKNGESNTRAQNILLNRLGRLRKIRSQNPGFYVKRGKWQIGVDRLIEETLIKLGKIEKGKKEYALD